MKFPTTILLFIIFVSNGYSQSDSTLHVSVMTNYTLDRASANGTSIQMLSTEAVFNKMKYAYVPTFRYKLMNQDKSNQVGSTIYRSFDQSYMSVTSFISNDELFPSLQLSTSYYHNLGKGVEVKLAYDYRSYSNDEENHMGIVGVSYEQKNTTIQYSVYQPLAQKPSHLLGVKKVLDTRDDYLQILYSNGQGNTDEIFEQSRNQVSSLTLSFGKKAVKKVNVLCNTSLSQSTKDEKLQFGYSLGLSMDLF